MLYGQAFSDFLKKSFGEIELHFAQIAT